MKEEQKLKKLEALLAMMDESLTKEDFVKSFENVIAYVKKIEDKTATDVQNLKATLESLAEKLRRDTTDDITAFQAEASVAISSQMKSMTEDYAQKMAQVLAKIDSVRDGKDADEELIVEKVLKRIPPHPILPPPYDDGVVKGDIDILYTKTEDLEKAVKEAKDVRVVAPSRGMFLYIDGVKKGIISNLNLKGGTNMAIAYSQVNGQDTLTFNASGGGPGGLTVETPPEAPNAVITTFTVSAEPQWVVADGTTYFDGQGYTYAALQVTMDIPPSATIRVII